MLYRLSRDTGIFPFRIIYQNENKFYHSKWCYEDQPEGKVLILDNKVIVPDGTIGIFVRKINAYKGNLTAKQRNKIAEKLGATSDSKLNPLVLYELLIKDEKLLLPEQNLVEVTDEEIDRILNE